MSNKNPDYDVIIVGGGPAGSTAGYLLKKKGYNVLIIEKEKFPRKKLCGGFITLKSMHLLNVIFEEKVRPFKSKDILNFCVNHYEINYKAERIVSRKNTNLAFCFADRAVFDNFLLDKAKNIGTKVIEGQKVEAVDLSNCEITLSNGSKLSSKFIIGADGANSVVKQEFISKKIIKKKKYAHSMATGLEYYVNRENIEDDWFDHPILFFGFIKWGYSWMFPNKERIVVGLGGLNRKNKGNFKNCLNALTKALKINPDSIYSLSGHPVPYGNFNFKPTYKDKIFLTGDAGGFVDPLFGEGIYYALETGLFAALSIDRSVKKNINPGRSYLYLLQQYIYPDLKAAKMLSRISFNPLNIKLKYHPISIIIKLLERQFVELIHGTRSFKRFQRKKNKVEDLYPNLFVK